jgi:hypothetical protein
MSVRSEDVLQAALRGALQAAHDSAPIADSWLDGAGFSGPAVFEISICGDLR